MGIDYSTVIAHPQSDVFAWHTMPGAMPRLMPPWQPLTVISEAGSLADGRAVLGLPAGLRWVAQHDPSGYVAGRRFVDELRVGWWRHAHEFG